MNAKPGYKTTEFWLSFAVTVTGIVVSSGAVTPGSYWERAIGVIAATLAALGYTSSRAKVKSEGPPHVTVVHPSADRSASK